MRNGVDGQTDLTGANIVKQNGQAVSNQAFHGASRYSVSNCCDELQSTWKAAGFCSSKQLHSILNHRHFELFRRTYRNIIHQVWERETPPPPKYTLYEYGKM